MVAAEFAGILRAIAVVVGSAIGSGIFRSPAGIADRVPGPFPLILMWVIGGLLSLCGALTLAEGASVVPKTGGIYAFLKVGWGRLPDLPASPRRVAVWIADDVMDGDGLPAEDSNGMLMIHVEAFGPRGAGHVVTAHVNRESGIVRTVSWREG